jgi:hypothetical protein
MNVWNLKHPFIYCRQKIIIISVLGDFSKDKQGICDKLFFFGSCVKSWYKKFSPLKSE